MTRKDGFDLFGVSACHVVTHERIARLRRHHAEGLHDGETRAGERVHRQKPFRELRTVVETGPVALQLNVVMRREKFSPDVQLTKR
ncbi:MAG: hypothetical protein R6V26_12345 [Roseovarius sp.]